MFRNETNPFCNGHLKAIVLYPLLIVYYIVTYRAICIVHCVVVME